MRAAYLLAAILALTSLGCGRGGGEVLQREGQPDVHQVRASDPEMDAAMAKARETLPTFIQRLKNAKEGELFSIKAGLKTSDGSVEHIWVADLTHESGRFKGVLANEPVDVPGKKIGDPIEVGEQDISDWLIFSGDKREGGYTVQVLEKRG